MSKLYRILMGINDVVGIVALLLMCAVILFQILARYLFHNAVPWPEEAARILFIITTYASIVYCLRQNGHLRIEVLEEIFPSIRRWADMFSIASIAIYFIFTLFMLWRMFRVVYGIGADFVTLPVPMWSIWLVIIFFCALIVITGTFLLFRMVRGKSATIEGEDE